MQTSTSAKADTSIPLPRDRRRGQSELSFAAMTVSHAIDYLVSEQIAGRRVPVQTNREAVFLLCGVFEQLAAAERRAPERKSILSRLSWFRTGHGSS